MMLNKIDIAIIAGDSESPDDINSMNDLIRAQSIIDLSKSVSVDKCSVDMLKMYWELGARKFNDTKKAIELLLSVNVNVTPSKDWDTESLRYLLDHVNSVETFDILRSRRAISMGVEAIIKYKLPEIYFNRISVYLYSINDKEIADIKKIYGYIPYIVFKKLCAEYEIDPIRRLLYVMNKMGMRPETAIQWMNNPKNVKDYFKYLGLNTSPIDRKYIIAAEHLDNYDLLNYYGYDRKQLYQLFVKRVLDGKLTKFNDTELMGTIMMLLRKYDQYNYINICEILARDYGVVTVYYKNGNGGDGGRATLGPAYIYKNVVMMGRPLEAVLAEVQKYDEREIPYKYINSATLQYKRSFDADIFIAQRATNINCYIGRLKELLLSRRMSVDYFSAVSRHLSHQIIAEELLEHKIQVMLEIILYALRYGPAAHELIKLYTIRMLYRPLMFLEYIDLIDSSMFKKILGLLTKASSHRINYRANLLASPFKDVIFIIDDA